MPWRCFGAAATGIERSARRMAAIYGGNRIFLRNEAVFVKNVRKFLHHFRLSVFFIALLCVGLGVAMLLWPESAMDVLGYAFGGVLVLSGILQVAAYLMGEKTGFLYKLQLIAGVIVTVVGVWVLLSPGKVLTLTVIVMGIVLLYHGVMDIKYGFDIRRCQGRNWGLAVIFGLVTCGVGVLVLVNPFATAQVLLIITGIGFIFDGLSDIFTVVTAASAARRFELMSVEPVIEISPSSDDGEALVVRETDSEEARP